MQDRNLLSACLLVLGLACSAESRSLDVNGLIFSSDLDPTLFPCRSWICNDETTKCTTHEEYFQYVIYGAQCNSGFQQRQPIDTPSIAVQDTCTVVNGECEFTTTQAPECVQSCEGFGHWCTTLEEYIADPVELAARCPTDFPVHKDVCIPQNGECEWHNPCVGYRGPCHSGYLCGTQAEYAEYLASALPPCAPPPFPPVPTTPPPGECIYTEEGCQWSECRSWLAPCGTSWICGTDYEYQISHYFPGRCHYDPLFVTPEEPGTCEYNVELGKCDFTKMLRRPTPQ
jgi:hypothetical protein